jgi:hypothetical protein
MELCKCGGEGWKVFRNNNLTMRYEKYYSILKRSRKTHFFK